MQTTLGINGSSLNYDGVAEGQSVTLQSTSTVLNVGKSLSTSYSGMLDTTYTFDIDKTLSDTPVISESLAHSTDKYLETLTVGTLTETGKVWMNSYQAQDYYSEEYSVGLEQTFT